MTKLAKKKLQSLDIQSICVQRTQKYLTQKRSTSHNCSEPLDGKYTGTQEKAELAWNLIHVPKENCELLNAQNTDMLNIWNIYIKTEE